MNKLALGMVLAAFSAGVWAAEVAGTTNVIAGGSATGAGSAAAAGTAAATNAALIAAGIGVAGMSAAGAKTQSTTSH